MALAKKCDRCGKLYECWPIGNVPGVYNAITLLRKANDGTFLTQGNKSIDFCPECMKAFDKFMSIEKVLDDKEYNHDKN